MSFLYFVFNSLTFVSYYHTFYFGYTSHIRSIFSPQIFMLVNIMFCKYFLEVLHLFAKCLLNLKIYIFFLSFKSDCIITELWNILAEFWRYTTTYVPWNDQTLTMYSNVPKHNCSLQFNTRTTLGNCDSSSTFYNIFLFLVCNLGHLEPIEL